MFKRGIIFIHIFSSSTFLSVPLSSSYWSAMPIMLIALERPIPPMHVLNTKEVESSKNGISTSNNICRENSCRREKKSLRITIDNDWTEWSTQNGKKQWPVFANDDDDDGYSSMVSMPTHHHYIGHMPNTQKKHTHTMCVCVLENVISSIVSPFLFSALFRRNGRNDLLNSHIGIRRNGNPD